MQASAEERRIHVEGLSSNEERARAARVANLVTIQEVEFNPEQHAHVTGFRVELAPDVLVSVALSLFERQ